MRCLPIAGAIVIAASAATALAVPGARAEGTGVIAAGPGAGLAAGSGAGTGAADRAAVAAALVAAIGARERVVGDAVAEARGAVAAGTVPAVALASFRRVRDRIDDGWRAFQRVQIDVAQDRLAEARAAAEALVALPGGPELYADAALRLGAVLQYRRNPDAPGLLALALALDPERPITLAEFSPDVVEAIDAVRAAPAVPARIHVAARPAGAIVSVDGKELGAAPLDAEVARGQHLVVARAPLHRAAVRAVAVDGAASVELALESDDAAVRLAGGAEPGLAPAAEQALVDAALALADLDDVVVAAVTDRRGGPALAVQRCAGAPARCTAVVEIGAGDRAGLPAAAREAWRAVQGGALRDPPGVLGDVRRPPPRSGCELCRNPLVWTGVGAVVIGAVIVFAVTSGARPPPVVTIDGHDFGH